jgi:outer membrane lipoprotein-sorting protein
MLPEQNLAKAREILSAAIQALGGDAYLNVRDISRTGRLSQFSSSGEMSGFVEVFDYSKLPDKRRREYSKRRNIIDVFNGEQGWSLDRAGVEDAPPTTVDSFQEALRRNVDHLLRFRLNKEKGLVLRFGGSDLLEMKQVDWVEVMDSERRKMRIAFDRSSHLPLRVVNFSRDPDSRDRIEEIEYLSNYHSIQGIQAAFHVERERAGRRVFEIVYSEVQFNTGLDDSFFTRQSLEARWAKIGKKK